MYIPMEGHAMFKNVLKKFDLYEQFLIKKLWAGSLFVSGVIGSLFIQTLISIYKDEGRISLGDLLLLLLVTICETAIFAGIIPGPALIYDLIRYRICWKFGEIFGNADDYMVICGISKRRIRTLIVGSDTPDQEYTAIFYDMTPCRPTYDCDGHMYHRAIVFSRSGVHCELYRDRGSIGSPSYYVDRHFCDWEKMGKNEIYTP